jgi:transposase
MKTRAGKPRDPAKERFWRRTIADQAGCGLSIRAYCQREGLETWNFQWWRQELDRRDAEVVSARIVERPASSSAPTHNSAFLPVCVLQDLPESTTTAGATPIEILLPAGLTVRVTPGFDPYALDAVLSVLEARRC